MSAINHPLILNRMPKGLLELDDFSLRECPMPEPKPGEILVRKLFIFM